MKASIGLGISGAFLFLATFLAVQNFRIITAPKPQVVTVKKKKNRY